MMRTMLYKNPDPSTTMQPVLVNALHITAVNGADRGFLVHDQFW